MHILSTFEARRSRWLPLILVILMVGNSGGCPKANDADSKRAQLQQPNSSDLSKKLGSLNSASWYLTDRDLDEFQPGRSVNEILKSVQWRGHFYLAADLKGQPVSAIVYELRSGDPKHDNGVWVWAIFVNNEFVKFVKNPTTLPGDLEVYVDDRGKRQTRRIPLKAGDTRLLNRAIDSEVVSIADLKEEVKSVASPPERQVDRGLTTAFLVLKAMGVAPSPGPPATENDYEKNAALRDQFNAARLNIGMPEREVEEVLNAKPLESGKVEAGSYRIYGSNESFNIKKWLHFSNVLVIFQEGKATAISSIPAGFDWRQELARTMVDLPAPSP